ncbi:MAG: hypothetical protein WD066_08745 [Planctomycetaceae bacterium]
MNPSNEPNHWNDERLDALLTDFFRREVPEELRHPRHAAQPVRSAATARPVVATVAPRAASAPADRAPGSAAGIVVSAVCLAMAVVLTWGTVPRPGFHDSTGATADGRGESAMETVRSGDAPVPGSRAPVESGTDVRSRTVPVSGGIDGTTIESELPELDVEIIPIEDDDREP